MRAKEFTFNVPITVSIGTNADSAINNSNQSSRDNLELQKNSEVIPDNQTSQDDTELQQNPVMVSPQQQELELKKAAAGKLSPVIDKLTQDQTIGDETPEPNDIIRQLHALMSR